jgi:hypothetical protein
VRSSINEALSAFQQSVNEAVQKRLGWPQQARAKCRRIWDRLRECPNENWDEVGAHLESRFDAMLRILADLRDGPVQALQERGYQIESATQLADDIRALEELKHDVLGTWPWSNQELPPIDWNMAREAMADIARGQPGEPIQDLIRRLGGKPGHGT